MERFVSLLSALAWPAATLVIALIFRSDVTRALGRVGRFRYRDLELTFREDLHNAEEVARSIPATPSSKAIVLELDPGAPQLLTGQLIGDHSPETSPSINRGEELTRLATRSPREAVEQAWGVVATTLELRSPLGPEALLVGLLRNLRDRARLDPLPPSSEEAQRFVDLALKVASRIEHQR